jgi:hypothetical protein
MTLVILHQIVSGCYAHSAILALAFRLETVIPKMCGMMHFHHSEMTHQSGNYCLPLNIWQHVIRKIQRKLYPRDFFGGVQAATSMQRSVLWKALIGLILIKGAVICNINWRIFLVISILPDIL